MNKKRFIKHLIMMCISSFIFGFACVFFIRGALGSDAMTTFLQGIYLVLNINISIGNMILSAIFVVIALIFDRKQVGLGTLVYIIVSSWSLNLAYTIIPEMPTLTLRIVSFACGILGMSIGIALGSKCDCGKNCYDALVFSIIPRVKKQYNVVRMVCDIIMFVFGILFGATYGIGTIVSILSIGNVAGFFMGIVQKNSLYKNFMEC